MLNTDRDCCSKESKLVGPCHGAVGSCFEVGTGIVYIILMQFCYDIDKMLPHNH